ncbi:hypothetical protein IscW_ISCW007626 [Ixodes scapularis]|uniref:Uncharacterized protein n=1 Tax=Ixodes scapularis TaxID=6945 RepID=B7PRH4_IXOSC|nr:hypothetical protein IscW_ISCW007626 [Ixodes scapularis]|eukprot:XP_002399658.1 hypothetical protein IscW_ISCW007626 [Ixodes scapularis]
MTTSVLKALRCEEYKSRSVGRAAFATYSVLRRLHSRLDNEFGIENQMFLPPEPGTVQYWCGMCVADSQLVTCGDDNKVVFWNAAGDGTGAVATCEPMATCEPVVLTAPGTVNGACGGTGGRPEHMTPKTPRRSRREPASLADWLTPPFKRRLHDGQPANKELTTPPRPVESPAVPPSAILTRKGHKMVARLFQRSVHQNRAKPRVKRALIIHNTKPITSFFNKWPE